MLVAINDEPGHFRAEFLTLSCFVSKARVILTIMLWSRAGRATSNRLLIMTRGVEGLH